MKLRTWFLLPTWLWMIALFIAPFAIVVAYSFLTRGVYGGVEQPWTLESYQRLVERFAVAGIRQFEQPLAGEDDVAPVAGVTPQRRSTYRTATVNFRRS